MRVLLPIFDNDGQKVEKQRREKNPLIIIPVGAEIEPTWKKGQTTSWSHAIIIIFATTWDCTTIQLGLLLPRFWWSRALVGKVLRTPHPIILNHQRFIKAWKTVVWSSTSWCWKTYSFIENGLTDWRVGLLLGIPNNR